MDDPEPILAAVLRSLSASRGKLADVARASGVPYHTLTKIAQGQVENPRIGTIQRLVDYFNREGADVPVGSAAANPTHASSKA
jgi:transcriptional regulator with XRE-family HTH domain